MRVIGGVLNTILASFAGSFAGGAAAGAAMMLVLVPNLTNAISVPAAFGALGIYFLGVVVMASLGPVGGVMFGFVPTLLLGMLLTVVRRLPPFQYLLVWAAAGASAGLAIYLWLPIGKPTLPITAAQEASWAVAWAAGGATSMSVYWLVGLWRLPSVTR